MKNLYDLLEISPAASDEVIKAAYRVLCNRYHPDKNFGIESATQEMSAINRAYAILSDPIRRKAYDALLATHVAKLRDRRIRTRTAEMSIEMTEATVRKIARLATERSYAKLAIYLSVIAGVLLTIVLIHEVAPWGPAGGVSLNAFKEPDPHLLRMKRGEALLSGNGSAQNFLQAKAEFEAIANDNDLYDVKGYRGRAAQRLGEIYSSGSGVPKDTAKAEAWFRRAAEYGRVVGPAPALAVAQFFEEGTNDKRNFVEAYRWYNLAAGTPFDVNKTAISRNAYNEIINLAKKKREELGAHLTMEQLNNAQLSPLPPCRFFNC